ncbi:hsp70 nucleotide exchange factor fes1, partial [Rhizophlyctis rosea]
MSLTTDTPLPTSTECIELIQNDSKPLEDRITAFDELEELVESLDNANDLRPLSLWHPILQILQSSPDEQLRMYAAWVVGTAVQNNEKAQKDFLDLNALPVVLHSLKNDTSPLVKQKLIYTLSSALSYPQIYTQFTSLNGFTTITQTLKDGDSTVLRRAIHLLTSLIERNEEGALDACGREGVVEIVLEVLENL